MPSYTQATRPLAVTTPLGADALLLVGLEGHEGLSELFSFQLDVLVPGTPLEFDRLLGQPATVRLEVNGSETRFINGIVSRLTEKGRLRTSRESPGFIRYRLELVPRLWLLTRRFQSRILQHLSVPDILKKVLQEEWGLSVTFQIQQSFEPRVRCIQYRETDLAFVSRLMEEEGIHYYFQHTENGHQLIVSDATSAPPQLPGPALIFEEVEGGIRPEARVTTWEKSQQLRSTRYTLWDHCFELPGSHLEASAQIRDAVNAGHARHPLNLSSRASQQERLEIYEYPGGYSHRFDGIDRQGAPQPDQLTKIFHDNERTARVRMQQEETQALSIEGASDCCHLVPGYQFTLEHHFDADGNYLLTRVEHSARLEDYLSGGEEFHYENHFRCLPIEVPFRPPSVTPRPHVGGSQTATVVGPEGNEIHCDRFGRVKVQFHWDRTDIDKMQGGPHILHDSSCWVRVGQVWAGKGFGAIQIPRVGQEVIVDFLEGDPDKPLIVGSVYNAEQAPPFNLPQFHTHSGLKSHSRGGNASEFSHLTFEDFRDGEHVHLHSEQDMTHSAEQHLVQNVGKEHHLHIGSSARRQVGGLPGLDHALWVGKSAMGSTPPPAATDNSVSWANWNTLTPQQRQQLVDEEIASQTAGPYYAVSPNKIFGGPAKDMDITFGWRTGNTVGLYTTLKLGVNQSTTLNPYALEDFVPGGPGGALFNFFNPLFPPFAGMMLRNAMGAVNVVIGANTSIHYGRKIDVQRGPNLITRATRGNKTIALAVVAGLFYNLAVLNEVFLPTEADEVSSQGSTALAATTAVLDLVALNVWAAAELECAGLSFLANSTRWVLACSVVNLFLPSSLTNAGGCVKRDELRFNDPQFNYLQGPEAEEADETQMLDSPYTLMAPSITLLSVPEPTDSDNTPGIFIQALGTEGTDGEVAIYGTGKATLVGGAQAVVQCVTEEEVTGKVTIDCGPVGTITLQSGLAQEPNVVILSPEGISQTSLVQVKASVEENSLTINPAMISLSSGPSSISITPEGITLSCGPASVSLTPEGVTISGVMVTISGDALVSIT